MDATKCSFAAHTQFDAIVTDPPYGLRAMSRSMKKKEDRVAKVVELGEVKEIKEEREEREEVMGK